MSFPERKKPIATEKGIQHKAPKHRENALRGKYQETQRTPMDTGKITSQDIIKTHDDIIKKKGGELIIPPEGFFVEGTEGPLKEGELERAVSWAKEIVKSKK